jgi:hypothetical protein
MQITDLIHPSVICCRRENDDILVVRVLEGTLDPGMWAIIGKSPREKYHVDLFVDSPVNCLELLAYSTSVVRLVRQGSHYL